MNTTTTKIKRDGTITLDGQTIGRVTCTVWEHREDDTNSTPWKALDLSGQRLGAYATRREAVAAVVAG